MNHAGNYYSRVIRGTIMTRDGVTFGAGRDADSSPATVQNRLPVSATQHNLNSGPCSAPMHEGWVDSEAASGASGVVARQTARIAVRTIVMIEQQLDVAAKSSAAM